jgi:hypothetical protein
MRKKLVVGVVEGVDVPSWGVFGIEARVDTGAETSALHVENLELLAGGRVAFEVRPKARAKKRAQRVRVVSAVVRRARVRSSNGSLASRLFVAARVQIGPMLRRIEVGLVDRRWMTYPMVLGRSALAGYFLVDPEKERVLSRAQR